MKNKNETSKIVWKFTNGKELTASEFTSYFERKVFRTIRKENLLPKDKIFKIKDSDDINTQVLKKVLEKKFQVKPSTSPNISSSNLSSEAENIFKNITKGKFTYSPKPSPFQGLMDKEIELYAKIKKISGEKRVPDKKIKSLFDKFTNKNQDLEINILKSQKQLNENEK